MRRQVEDEHGAASAAAVERVKKLDDDFGPAIAVEVDHLELEVRGNAVGFLGGAHVVGQGIDHAGLNVERGLMRAGHRRE